jgi:hypothetical protein
MEFSNDKFKHIIAITDGGVGINVINRTTGEQYGQVINPARYPKIRNVGELYALICYSFQVNDSDHRLELALDHVENAIFMRLNIPSAEVSINEVLRSLDPHLATNDVEHIYPLVRLLYTTMQLQAKELQELREQMRELQNHVHQGLIGRTDKSSKHYSTLNKVVINGDTVVLGNSVMAKDHTRIDLMPACLQAANAAEIEINEDRSTGRKLTRFIQTSIHTITNVRKLMLSDINLETVESIAKLPNLMQLELRRCGPIRDMHLLTGSRSLLVVNVTVDSMPSSWPAGIGPRLTAIQ